MQFWVKSTIKQNTWQNIHNEIKGFQQNTISKKCKFIAMYWTHFNTGEHIVLYLVSGNIL